MKNFGTDKEKYIRIAECIHEHGDGAISYAMYFIAVIMVLILYMFFKFNSDLYVAEEVLENGLHIAENKILTVNQAGLEVDEYSLDNELRRFHIVTSYNTDNSLSSQEITQLKNIATEFSSTLQTQYELDGSFPKSGILKDLCAEGSAVKISSPVYLYEPVYKRTITVFDDGTIPESTIKKFVFESEYTIVAWIKYELNYDENNTFTYATKQIVSQPKLNNGSDVIGATIEATVDLTIAGVTNIFDMTDSHGNASLFSNNPQSKLYNISVTQSADIVISTNDTRDTKSNN